MPDVRQIAGTFVEDSTESIQRREPKDSTIKGSNDLCYQPPLAQA